MLDVIYPPVCLLCGSVSEGPHPHCCPECTSGFHLIGSSCCPVCGLPFPVPDEPHLCLGCMKKTQPFNWCRGLYLFSGSLAEAVSALKYRRKMSLANVLVSAMLQALPKETMRGLDAIVPVPLSTSHLLRRGFNQAVVLASPLAESFDLPLYPLALKRKGAMPQVGLGLADREKNVRGAFTEGRDLKRVSGKRVLLFDDVYTTGATVRECCRALKRAGAEPSVLTLARARI